MTGLYIVLTIAGLVLVLLMVALVKSELGKYKFRSPFQKVQPKKNRKVTKKKKPPFVQITFNKR